MKTALSIASAALLSTTFSYAGGEGWMHDFEAAKKKAAAENKDLLIDFTGSDWCHWCIKLNEEVFQHDAFKNGIKDNYILVELDYPQDKSKQSEATIKQNEKLQETYAVQGFPTILLTDAQGRPYARSGYQDGGPEKYVAHLAELQGNKTKRDEAFAKAEKLEGAEKAKALYEGVMVIPEDFQHTYKEVIAEIKTLDPEDTTGLAKADAEKGAMMELEKGLSVAMQAGKADEAMALVDKYVADNKPEGDKKQEVMSIKISLLMHLQKFEEADKVATEIVAISPESELAKNIKQFQETQLAELRKEAAGTEEKPKEEEKK